MQSQKNAYTPDMTQAEIDQHWSDISKRIHWRKPWSKLKEISFKKPVSIKWYLDGELNVSENCIDRHLKHNADKVAIIWEPDNPKEEAQKITYKQLSSRVSEMANILKKHGVKKGDFVTIYLPMIPEAAYAMLACTRIGAVHSVVFGGFSPDSLADRIRDCDSSFLITADEGLRGGKPVALKKKCR